MGSLVWGCNEHPLRPLNQVVEIQREEIYAQAERTQIDVLWVVDNSGSMAEEQATLASQFNTFIEGLSGLQASFHIGVVATDMEKPEVAGRFRYQPAMSSYSSSSYLACKQDEQCGTGECLCGLPWIRRCSQQEECEEGEICLHHTLPAGQQSQLAYCAKACAEENDCQGDTSNASRTLHCIGGRCQFQLCAAEEECPTGQQCVPVSAEEGAISFCRRFMVPSVNGTSIRCQPGKRGLPCPLDGMCSADGKCEAVAYCPPQTCDCPKSLPTILKFNPDPMAGEQIGRVELSELQYHFRCMALLGTDGSATEKGLEAAERALTAPLAATGGPNDGFLRENAYLVIIFLSDENDCSDRGQVCKAVEECPQSSNAACKADPVEPKKKFCRLPKREAQECEYWRSRLIDTSELAATIKDLKATPDLVTSKTCEQQRDCPLQDGQYCSRKFNKCVRSSGRVITAAIVGDRDLYCTEKCPSIENEIVFDCEQSEACTVPCPAGEFCAERVYTQSNKDVASTCQDLVFGTAFSGRRYIEFLESFGDHSAVQSICRGDLSEALSKIAELVSSVIPSSWCLSRPLPGCRSNDDCRKDAICTSVDAASSPKFCQLPDAVAGEGRRQPADLLLEVRNSAGLVIRTPARSDWRFRPSVSEVVEKGQNIPATGGCISFDENAPRSGESLVLRYLTPLDPAAQ